MKIGEFFFSSRDETNRSHVGWFDINLDDPSLILDVSTKPMLKPGPVGRFDGNGIYASSAVRLKNDSLRFYTIGWNPGHVYPLFYASIGYAESDNNGKTINYRSTAPIMDRSIHDPTSVTGPCVIFDDDKYKMWYVSGLKWISRKNKHLKSIYHIKYAISNDGLNWKRNGHVAIDFKSSRELNIARPCVLKTEQGYESWFSYGYGGEYQIGYAVSVDGIKFNRDVSQVKVIKKSNQIYENKAVCHPFVVIHKGKKFMFYNGNSFGIDGIALAEENK